MKTSISFASLLLLVLALSGCATKPCVCASRTDTPVSSPVVSKAPVAPAVAKASAPAPAVEPVEEKVPAAVLK